MSKGNAATIVASKETVLTVKNNAQAEKKFNPQESKTVIPLNEEVKTAESKKIDSPKDEKPKEVKKETTLQDLKDRAAVVFLLQEKHTKLVEKRASLDRFEISHDKDNAKITVEDATGEEFESSSPKSIRKLIEFWKEEFDEVIMEIENRLKAEFAK